MLKLDLKDRKLLYELDQNSRQTFQQLAKKIGLSKDAVKYRINKLIEIGIIKSFNAVIDTGKMGFISFRIFLRFFQTSPEKEKEIIDFLLSNKNLVWLVQVEGNWDINTLFLYKSIAEMNAFLRELLDKYGNFIAEKEFGIYTNVSYFGRTYLNNQAQNYFVLQAITLPQNNKLNSTEIKIIETLSKNARVSILEIAQESGLTSKTVISKIKQLETDKIILGYRTEFDLEKIGYKYYKLHLTTFNTNPNILEQLKQYILQHPNIIYSDEVLGGYDIEIEVQVENEDKLREFIDDFREQFSPIIKDYQILHYFKEYKLRFFPVE